MSPVAASATTEGEAPGGVSYARRLNLFDAVMVVVGGIVGAGIFLNPAVVAQRAGTTPLILTAWAIGGAIALLGAFCFAELGARRPQSGGGYVYLREAYGPKLAFLYGWTLLVSANTGGVAAVAITFARYTVDLVGAGTVLVKPLAVAALVVLTAINAFGIRPGATVQNVFTSLKLVALAGVVLVGLTAAAGLATAAGPAPVVPLPSGGVVAAIATSIIPVLFAYGGWQHANHVAGELREPQRTLPRALLIGVALVVTVYLLANIAYLRALGPAGLAGSVAPASETVRAVAGAWGGKSIAAGIAISTFGILNLFILAAPRVYQAMAEDGVFFRGAAKLHPRWRTPVRALAIQCVWAIVLVLSGTYGQLLDWVVFGDWIFFSLVASTLFVFRSRERSGAHAAHTGYRLPGYPVVPGLFVLAGMLVVASSIASNPRNALLGSILIAAGLPIYAFWRRGAVAESG